ncbi:kinase-like domain-containing protein [Rhodocollybia butyracea]|uniref:Kinase-like domain-containing protein n=1 Tax=Rhodocollybia butyracea TaxID=206335 RepID=A0A9P5Q2R1_9AGAR|nr:kinase-like domain-containing protein [Rhodocollybia butyracea]
MKTAPGLPDAMFTLGRRPEGRPYWNVFDLCSDTVVKLCSVFNTPTAEARALAFVHSNTSIPVPRIRRYIKGQRHGYLLMEKIPGKRLDRVWPSYTPLQKFIVAWTLRGYIRQLRQASAAYARRHIPGPISDKPERCNGIAFLFGDRPRGPFNSSKELVAHFDKSGECLDYTQPLVLTHGDLSMRNVIVGDDGRLWLVDWTWSAFYPPYFEYIATMSAADNDDADHSWRKHIPIVTDGACVKELNFLQRWGSYAKG